MGENLKCEVCGADEWVLSRIRLTACYGSRYDGADVELAVCGECLDGVIELLADRAGHADTDAVAAGS